jgi:pimeloyl-ACP methyl ester carboxylesterase
MSTIERLQNYYPFDEDVLADVEAVAGEQNSRTWQEFLAHCGVEQPEIAVCGDKAAEFVAFQPAGDFDETKARIFHGPMGNSLDPNIAYQAATVFAADPTTRLFVVASPSGVGNSAGLLVREERRHVAGGDLRPTVEPALRLLQSHGVEQVTHIGGSFGAEKAMTAAGHSSAYDHETHQVVAIDPPSVVQRSLGRLGLAYFSTGKPLERYIAASDSAAFLAARELSIGRVKFAAGLSRLTNLAIARGLAHELFESRAEAAFRDNPDMQATISWGSASELADDTAMHRIASNLADAHRDQVQTLRLPGQYHAAMNDIHLQAAVVLQASRYTSL